MQRKTLMRDARAANLERLENAARTLENFEELVDMYDKLDANRERRERYHEITQGEYNLQYTGSKKSGYRLTFTETRQKDKDTDDQQNEKATKSKKKDSSKNYHYNEGVIIPPPINHPYWRELMRGDFISYIFDNYMEVWQVFGDWQVGGPYRDKLTAKQKEALFLSAVRLATTEQIGCYTDKIPRAVRRLIATALENIRKPLAEVTRKRIDDELPVTLEKLRFLEWYEAKKPDGSSGEK